MSERPRHQIGGYQEFAVPADTAFFAEACWIHRGPAGSPPAGSAHRVLPEFGVSVAFDVVRSEDGRPLNGVPLLIGPKRRPQLFPIVPGRELTAIRIKPEWVAPMLGIDPLDAESLAVDLAAFCPALAEPLRETLLRTRTAEDALRALARAVVDGRVSRADPSHASRHALDTTRRAHGRMPCDDLAGLLGLSVRQLRRQVHDATGISPKRYARTLRLLTAVRIADGSTRPVWADVAARAGYCDQSHLIRECLATTGRTPRALHHERRRQIVDVAEMSNHG